MEVDKSELKPKITLKLIMEKLNNIEQTEICDFTELQKNLNSLNSKIIELQKIIQDIYGDEIKFLV